MTLRTTLKEYSQWGFRGDNGKWMEVGVWVNYKQGFQDMAIFTPYWLINKTGLPLSYKVRHNQHSSSVINFLSANLSKS